MNGKSFEGRAEMEAPSGRVGTEGSQPRRATPAEIVQARSEADFISARALFAEYADQLGVDLCFQNFGFELEHLHEMYGPPTGCLLLAREGSRLVGCVAVRRLSERVCEMKRLYVREQVRGSGLGRQLAIASITGARMMGYNRMVLDTLAEMTVPLGLYASLGFRETEPYYPNPLTDVVYMELDLRIGA
jgi:putative acetyltransferase